jgi:S1-C subfamily serine protease
MRFNFRSPLIWAAIISLVIGGLSGAIFAFLAWGFLPATPSGVFINRIVRPTATSTPLGTTDTVQIVQDEGDLTVSVVKKVSPAVVSIIVSKDVSKLYNQTGLLPFDNDFFKQFGLPFEIVPQQPAPQGGQKKSGKQVIGGGSGFIVRADGLIVTNKHVVADTEADYTVVLSNGKQYPATVLAKDVYLDIAVIKIEAGGLPTVLLGNSDNLVIGQTVIAIGNALGEYKNTVTRGIISGIKRRVVAGTAGGGSEVIEEAIQTDAAINPGNSGGPLLNLRGEVVGINTAINREGQAVGFALPINSVKNIIQSVEKHGRIVRPWLGVRYILLNKEIAERNNLAVDYGALLIKGQSATELAVMAGSPADKAGLVENDIILEVNGKKITEENTLSTLVGKFKVGDEITLKIFHKGETKDVKLKMEELPPSK